MYAFCTYCSKHKDETPGDMPAIQRYLDPRIRRVHEAAGLLGLEFYILSGEFGLIPPDQPIPWYDHLLLAEEVDELAEQMGTQIRQYGIEGVVYFTNSMVTDAHLAPYQDAILEACRRASCPCAIFQVSLQDEP